MSDGRAVWEKCGEFFVIAHNFEFKHLRADSAHTEQLMHAAGRGIQGIAPTIAKQSVGQSSPHRPPARARQSHSKQAFPDSSLVELVFGGCAGPSIHHATFGNSSIIPPSVRQFERFAAEFTATLIDHMQASTCALCNFSGS